VDGAYMPASGEPLKGFRRVRVAGATAAVQAAIYHRAAMPVGLIISGPAIVEQDDSTTLVEPGWSGRVLPDGTLLLTASRAGSTRDGHK
jgi:N-methylhydantoinase A